MSNEYINGVIAHSQSKRSARAVLVAIANRTLPDGTSRPGLATIADEAGVSERTATRAIKQLVAMGELAISEASHQHVSPQYRILLQPEKRAQSRQNVTPEAPIQGRQIDARGDNVSSRGDNLSSRGDNVTLPTYTRDLNPIEPKKEPRENPTRARREPKLYPLKAKPKAPSHHLKGVRLVDGYVPAGTGKNAVQVYYERFSFDDAAAHLSAPNEDDLARLCPDLDRLRAIITEYSQTQGYRPGNVKLILDWYRGKTSSERREAAALPSTAVSQRGAVSKIDASMAAIDRVEKMLIEQGVFQ